MFLLNVKYERVNKHSNTMSRKVANVSKLKDLLRNEYVKSLIFLIIILGSIVAFWFALKTYLKTDFPLLAVASESMLPTLNVGDLIVVQGGFGAEDIFAAYNIGDIIVFYSPRNPSELIVHRAVDKQEISGIWYITTKGDNNPGIDNWNNGLGVPENEVVGKVVGIVPYVGHIPLFVHTTTGLIIIAILIVILVLLEFIIPIIREKAHSEQAETGILDIDSM